MIYVFTSFDEPIIAVMDGPDLDLIAERKMWVKKNWTDKLKFPPKPEIVPPAIITSQTQAAMMQPINEWGAQCASIEANLKAALAKEHGLLIYSETDCFLVYLRRSKKFKDIPYKEG